MKITITYCVVWNYLPNASSLAAAIRESRGIEPELIEGGKGIFDVKLDGELVYSKYETGRFPENDEVLDKIPVLANW